MAQVPESVLLAGSMRRALSEAASTLTGGLSPKSAPGVSLVHGLHDHAMAHAERPGKGALSVEDALLTNLVDKVGGIFEGTSRLQLPMQEKEGQQDCGKSKERKAGPIAPAAPGAQMAAAGMGTHNSEKHPLVVDIGLLGVLHALWLLGWPNILVAAFMCLLEEDTSAPPIVRFGGASTAGDSPATQTDVKETVYRCRRKGSTECRSPGGSGEMAYGGS